MDRPVVLVVLDKSVQRDVLAQTLMDEGLAVRLVDTANDGMSLIETQPPDIILLNSKKADTSGIEMCRRLKMNSASMSIPIIMLSASFDEADRLRGSKTGADDYLIKPYSMFDLMGRVRIQLRRNYPYTGGPRLEYDGIVLDLEAHLVYTAGQAISVNETCRRLLATFLEEPGRVWSREELIARVWDRDNNIDIRTVDVHIMRLRKAFTRKGVKDPLMTVRGVGYILA